MSRGCLGCLSRGVCGGCVEAVEVLQRCLAECVGCVCGGAEGVVCACAGWRAEAVGAEGRVWSNRNQSLQSLQHVHTESLAAREFSR